MEWAGGVSDICIGSMWEIEGGDFLGMDLGLVYGVLMWRQVRLVGGMQHDWYNLKCWGMWTLG